MPVSEIWSRALAAIRADPRRPREPIEIPADHVIAPAPAPQPPIMAGGDEIEAGKDYVVVTLNQLFLADSRLWFTQIEPTVFASTEFLYAGEMRSIPVVVGPRLDENLPRGTVIKNMPLFGPHPYRGGPFTFTFVLSRLPTGNIARDMLDVVEAASAVLAPGLGLATYTKIGDAVIDGFGKLMGLSEVTPLIGLRETINPDAGQRFRPGRWALIDADDPDPAEFWVVRDVLLKGRTLESAVPYREADFMLYQFARPRSGMRGDTDRLPFNALWMRALAAASQPSADAWDEAKANFGAMISAISTSPDLTKGQYKALIAERREEIVALHADTMQNQLMAAGDTDARAPERAQISDILRLP